MHITKTDVDALNANITLSIEKIDYSESVNKILKEHQKKAQIDGFRKGKVPLGMIKGIYGTAVLMEELNKIVDKELSKYIHDNQLKILGKPLPSEDKKKPIDWKNDEQFEFTFDIALVPEFNLNISKQDKIKYYRVIIEDDMIKERINYFTRFFSEKKEIDAIDENALLKGALIQTIDGNPIIRKDASISVKHIMDEKEKEKFLGKKVDETIAFDIRKAFPNATDLAALLSINKKKADEISHTEFHFTATEINQFVPAKIDKRLFEKIFKKNEVKTKEEFEGKVMDAVAGEWEKNSDLKFFTDIRNILIKKTKIKLPESFLKRWMLTTDKEKKLENIEANFDKSMDDIRWTLIKNKIMDLQKIKVSEKDIIKLAKMNIEVEYSRLGLTNISEQELEESANKVLENKDYSFQLYTQLSDKKVIDYLKDVVTPDYTDISKTAFLKMTN